jgi:RNA polymerase sigma-70 factor (ECF subfamily)
MSKAQQARMDLVTTTHQQSDGPALAAGLDDSQLVPRLRQGDHEAFETVMRHNNQRLFRIARAILKDDHEAEDTVQNAYIALYSRTEEFASHSAVGAWLSRVTANSAISRLRQSSRAIALEANEELKSGSSGEPTPEDVAGSSELRRVLEKAIDTLPTGLRSVMVLRDVEGMSGAETAECLGISEPTARVRLHRARTQLRSWLEENSDSAIRETFAFAGARCDRIVAHVLAWEKNKPSTR